MLIFFRVAPWSFIYSPIGSMLRALRAILEDVGHSCVESGLPKWFLCWRRCCYSPWPYFVQSSVYLFHPRLMKSKHGCLSPGFWSISKSESHLRWVRDKVGVFPSSWRLWSVCVYTKQIYEYVADLEPGAVAEAVSRKSKLAEGIIRILRFSYKRLCKVTVATPPP